MASLHTFILLHFILSSVLQSSGLMSDYKTCGDDACARLMCRVQALRDHGAQDCRFLSFKKGDMIDVYHKLTGKRSNLWAGSIDKQFGYFARDAVKIDEIFVDEKKEMKMRAQRTDFFCMDAFGTVTSSEEEFEDYESGEQTAETEDLGNGDFDAQVSKAPESDESVGARHSNNDNKGRGKAEESGSSWIGSAVQGWFANNVKEEADGLNVQGFGEGNADPSETRKLSQGTNMQEAASPKGEDPAERIGEHERSVVRRDEGWYDSVYNRITHFYQDRNEAIGKDEGIENKDGDKVPIFEDDPGSCHESHRLR